MKNLLLFFALLLTGCVTVSSLPQTGGILLDSNSDVRNYTNSRIYSYSYTRVFEATKIVLRAWNFTIVKANTEDYAILASGQNQNFSSGAVIGLYFSQLAPTKILVETIEKRKIPTQITIKWHSSIILD